MHKLKPILFIMCLLLLSNTGIVRASTENQVTITYGQVNHENVSVYKSDSKKSKICGNLHYGDIVTCRSTIDDDWFTIETSTASGYVQSKYITPGGLDYKVTRMPKTSGFKSFMYSSSITSWNPAKVKKLARVGKYGILTVNDRYCVAVGTAVGSRVGQYIDVVLNNGTVLPCIMCDTKDPKDCDTTKLVTRNGCCTEFVVDKLQLDKRARAAGSLSAVSKKWKSPVAEIRVYPYNVLHK